MASQFHYELSIIIFRGFFLPAVHHSYSDYVENLLLQLACEKVTGDNFKSFTEVKMYHIYCFPVSTSAFILSKEELYCFEIMSF